MWDYARQSSNRLFVSSDVLPGQFGVSLARGVWAWWASAFGVLGLESGVWFDMSGATSGEEMGEKASIRQGRLGLLGQRVLLVWLELAS